jgi:hypothetical protein
MVEAPLVRAEGSPAGTGEVADGQRHGLARGADVAAEVLEQVRQAGRDGLAGEVTDAAAAGVNAAPDVHALAAAWVGVRVDELACICEKSESGSAEARQVDLEPVRSAVAADGFEGRRGWMFLRGRGADVSGA